MPLLTETLARLGRRDGRRPAARLREAVAFARMAGSSIAAPDAAGWVTDFLNASYFRREGTSRELDDLRLAFGILTTRWHRQGGRRLRLHDAAAFHAAFGRDRFLDGGRSARGTLDGFQLREGAARLLGDDFPAAWADPDRRGWGIAFPDRRERAAYAPERRLAAARLGPLSPPGRPHAGQTWHTYPAVAMPSVAAAAEALAAVARWPDYAAELGRFTPLRSGGLLGQTFEIEVAAGTDAGLPVYTRGYVTATRLLTRARDPVALDRHVASLEAGLAEPAGPATRAEPGARALPLGATAHLALDLTTHEGHFLGAARSRLVLFEHAGAAFLRDVGVWEPMPWMVARAYAHAGEAAQRDFWGGGSDPRRSMLHQLALAAGGRG